MTERVPVVHVVGSINVDTIVRVERLPGPGETVFGGDVRYALGGKGANQALAAAARGARVVLAGAVGDDDAGRFALAELAGAGVELGAVRRHADAATGIALIAVDPEGENTIIVASGANRLITADVTPAAGDIVLTDVVPTDVVPTDIELADVVLTQGEVPVEAIAAAAAAASRAGARFVLNLAPVVEIDPIALAVCDPLIVNEHEAAALGIRAENGEWGDAATAALARVRSIVITLGAAGSVYADSRGTGTGTGTVPAVAAEVVDTTGAGDAFTGALAAALAGGADLRAAVEAGAAYAAVVIGVVGANALAGDRQG